MKWIAQAVWQAGRGLFREYDVEIRIAGFATASSAEAFARSVRGLAYESGNFLLRLASNGEMVIRPEQVTVYAINPDCSGRSEMPVESVQFPLVVRLHGFENLVVGSMSEDGSERHQHGVCSLCSAKPADGFFTGCLVRDLPQQDHNGWQCDGRGMLTRPAEVLTARKLTASVAA